MLVDTVPEVGLFKRAAVKTFVQVVISKLAQVYLTDQFSDRTNLHEQNKDGPQRSSYSANNYLISVLRHEALMFVSLATENTSQRLIFTILNGTAFVHQLPSCCYVTQT